MPKTEPAPTPAPATNSSIALHPLLMAETQSKAEHDKNEKRRERDRYKTMAPKFSTVKANAAVAPPPGKMVPVAAPVLNPYAARPETTATDEAGGSAGGPGPGSGATARRSRKMHFSAPGKYVQQGEVLRNEEKMEALRQRIAEASKKAGLDSEFDTLERSLKVSG